MISINDIDAYWLCEFEGYEARGGLRDLTGKYDTITEAIRQAKNVRLECDIWGIAEDGYIRVASHIGRCPILDKDRMFFRWAIHPPFSLNKIKINGCPCNNYSYKPTTHFLVFEGYEAFKCEECGQIYLMNG